MSRSLRLLWILLALALGSLALAACGGGDDEASGQDVNAVLQETFDGKGTAVNSGKLDLRLKLDLEGAGENLSGPISIGVSGPFENQGAGEVPRFDFNLNLDGSGQQFQAGAISTGSKAYLRFQDQAYEVGDDIFKEFKDGYVDAQKQDGGEREAGPSLGALGIDPRRWLKNPTEVGTEDVGGAETIHLRADVDVPRLLEDVNRLVGSANNLGVGGDSVPDQLTAEERARAAQALKSVKVDIWTGKDDKTLRKFTLALDISVPASERKRAGLSGGKVDVEYEIADLNKPQKLAEPSNARPLSDLNEALKALGLNLGSAAGGSSGGSATTTPAPAATAEAPATGSEAYLECLDQAGEDAAKIQECTALIAQP